MFKWFLLLDLLETTQVLKGLHVFCWAKGWWKVSPCWLIGNVFPTGLHSLSAAWKVTKARPPAATSEQFVLPQVVCSTQITVRDLQSIIYNHCSLNRYTSWIYIYIWCVCTFFCHCFLEFWWMKRISGGCFSVPHFANVCRVDLRSAKTCQKQLGAPSLHQRDQLRAEMKQPKYNLKPAFRVSSISEKAHVYCCAVGSGCLCSLSPCKGSTVQKALQKLQDGSAWAAAKWLIVLYIRMSIISFTKHMATDMTSWHQFISYHPIASRKQFLSNIRLLWCSITNTKKTAQAQVSWNLSSCFS